MCRAEPIPLLLHIVCEKAILSDRGENDNCTPVEDGDHIEAQMGSGICILSSSACLAVWHALTDVRRERAWGTSQDHAYSSAFMASGGVDPRRTAVLATDFHRH
jgi:hypothetical protein